MPSATVEDYVKAIYLAEQELAPAVSTAAGRVGKRPKGGARVSERGSSRGSARSPGRAAPGSVALGALAVRMRVVPGTATSMVKALAEAGLVLYEPRRGVRLTPGGTRLALHVLRRHRLVELFLVRTLGFDWAEVHDEAEALEHVVSDKLVERLDALLGHPRVDPHGDPIPTHAGKLQPERARPLLVCAAGDQATVLRVDNHDPAFLRYAERQGLVPGASLDVRTHDTDAGALTLTVRGRPVSLGHPAASRIWVSV